MGYLVVQFLFAVHIHQSDSAFEVGLIDLDRKYPLVHQKSELAMLELGFGYWYQIHYRRSIE